MAKATLFVCESCGIESATEKQGELSEGTVLLNQLLELAQTWSRQSELRIQGVGCLCICDRPCAVAIAGVGKPTFLFVDLLVLETASDILVMSELYLDSEDGYVPRFQLPPRLQSARLARIPPIH